jgi:nucleoside-diphosphate-sugar epimerase
MDYSFEHPLVSPDAVASWVEALPRPVAITGGTGFVGSHLVETLCAAGIEPRVLARDPASPRWISGAPVRLVPGSLDDPQALAELVDGAGCVLHLAGVLRAGTAAGFDRGNREGTANLVRAIRRRAPKAHLVHVSSLAAVGPSEIPEGVGPHAVPAPISHYGRSKLAAEQEVRALGEDVSWAIVRPPAIYGPRDTDVFEFFRMADRGVVALPAGERWLTVAWVGDVVRSVLAAVGGASGVVYHVGELSPVLLDDLVRVLSETGGVTARIVRVPAPLVVGLGAVGSGLHRLGFGRLALTRDKSRELLARHWTSQTRSSLEALGVLHLTDFRQGALTTWSWYREKGWLRNRLLS